MWFGVEEVEVGASPRPIGKASSKCWPTTSRKRASGLRGGCLSQWTRPESLDLNDNLSSSEDDEDVEEEEDDEVDDHDEKEEVAVEAYDAEMNT